jgi:protein-tyrosine phosphatase
MITKVWERLYIGDAKSAERLAGDNPLDINAVISFCPEPIPSRNPRINYVQIPMPDGSVEPEILDSIVNAIAIQIRKGKLLLHCSAGFSRSPCMAALWLDTVGYQSFDAALREIVRLRPVADPSPGLVDSVREYLRR